MRKCTSLCERKYRFKEYIISSLSQTISWILFYFSDFNNQAAQTKLAENNQNQPTKKCESKLSSSTVKNWNKINLILSYFFTGCTCRSFVCLFRFTVWLVDFALVIHKLTINVYHYSDLWVLKKFTECYVNSPLSSASRWRYHPGENLLLRQTLF